MYRDIGGKQSSEPLAAATLCIRWALVCWLACTVLPARSLAITLLDIDFQADPAGTLLNDVTGWTQLTESSSGGRLQIADEPGGNLFLTTELGNNEAGRYAIDFTNPGFSSSTTLTLTMDVWDPLVNPQSGLSTFPRALAGIFERTGTTGMPPYVGLEHVSLGQNSVSEWVMAGENFANRQFAATDGVAQDTWYTLQSTWDFSAGTKNMSVKTRDGVDPFVEVLSASPIGFANPAQDLSDLNSLAVRMNRGTRIDNISVTYDDPSILPPQPLIDIAQARPDVPGAPQPSDVVFSVRSFSSSPSEYPAIAAGFNATRNDWTYSAANTTAVNTLAAQGMTSGGAMNPSTHGIPSTSQGIARHWDGVTPLSRYNDTRYNGDVNASEYRNAALAQLKNYISAGNQRVQWDDPRLNTELVVMFGGSFAPASVTKYNTWLADNTTAQQRTAEGLPANLAGFDYRVFVENANGNVSSQLYDWWLTFHHESTIEYLDWLKAEIDAFAGYYVPFSSNNISKWDLDSEPPLALPEYVETYRWFDYSIGELRPSDANPSFMHNSARRGEELEKRQVFTLGDDDTNLNRKTMAYSYALGAHMVMPWDVFIPNAPRLFGDPNDYNDITSLVRDNAHLYDGYESAGDVGPGIADPRIDGFDPVKIGGGSGQVYAHVRAVPGNIEAPLVVHLVDWDNTPQGFSVELLNESFGWPTNIALSSSLMTLDGSDVSLTGAVDGLGYTEVSVSALAPYGLLVVDAYPLTADFDMDGDVDSIDLTAWEAGFGTSSGATKAMGDSDNDGDVDGYDFLNWQRQAGQSFSPPATIAVVPEPSALTLLLVALGWQMAVRRS